MSRNDRPRAVADSSGSGSPSHAILQLRRRQNAVSWRGVRTILARNFCRRAPSRRVWLGLGAILAAACGGQAADSGAPSSDVGEGTGAQDGGGGSPGDSTGGLDSNGAQGGASFDFMPIDPSESVSVTETENFEQQVFTRITVGDVACGVSGMFVVCEDKTYELDSPILDIQASSLFDFLTCALLASGKILCLGDPPQLLESTDKYTMLSVSDTGLCALSERGVIHCTGAEPGGGPFIAVSAGNGYSCGITASGELVCFSETEVDSGGSARIYFDAPEGKFKAVSVSKHLVRAACAINEGLGAVCWTPQVAPEQGYRFFPQRASHGPDGRLLVGVWPIGRWRRAMLAARA